MDDVVRETFQRESWITTPRRPRSRIDVWPIFDRLTGLQWVNHGLFVVHGYGSPLDARDAAVIAQAARRVPPANARLAPGACSRCSAIPAPAAICDEPKIPQIYGDAYDKSLRDAPARHALALLAVTTTQYAPPAALGSLATFADDWPARRRCRRHFAALIAGRADRASRARRRSHDCLGGPFHPGIEITWVMRLPRLWTRPTA